MMVDEVEKAVALEFNCPVCKMFMSPPIFQCATGHSFCSHCFERLSMCPKCWAPKGRQRNYSLEAIYPNVTFSCKFEDEGCAFKARGPDFHHHQNYCEFLNKLCPLRLNTGCDWDGRQNQIEDHCRREHQNEIFFDCRQEFVVKDFDVESSKQRYMVFFVFDEIFRCTWDFNKYTGLMKIAMYHLKKPASEQRFNYRLAFFADDKEVEAFSMKAPCEYLVRDITLYNKGHYQLINGAILESCLDRKGVLNYTVQIIDNDHLKNLFNSN